MTCAPHDRDPAAPNADSAGGAPLRQRARAKLNLGLKVLGRRPDGFHDIAGIFQTLDLADVLEFRPAARDRLTCTDPTLSTGDDNLVCRAVVAFRAAVPSLRPVHVRLDKRIPRGAGLGGGSADAAATLVGLNRLSGRPLAPASLAELGLALGSDVPFALMGGTARVGGRGEHLEPLAWDGPRPQYVLACPGEQVSTAWAYGQLDLDALTGPSPYRSFLNSLRGGRVDGSGLLQVLENDFQPLVEGAKPIVAELSSQLRRLGAHVCSMTGTGSTVYGVFDDRIAAQSACEQVRAGGCRSFLCVPADYECPAWRP